MLLSPKNFRGSANELLSSIYIFSPLSYLGNKTRLNRRRPFLILNFAIERVIRQ